MGSSISIAILCNTAHAIIILHTFSGCILMSASKQLKRVFHHMKHLPIPHLVLVCPVEFCLAIPTRSEVWCHQETFTRIPSLGDHPPHICWFVRRGLNSLNTSWCDYRERYVWCRKHTSVIVTSKYHHKKPFSVTVELHLNYYIFAMSEIFSSKKNTLVVFACRICNSII